jgi:hypothetical protein
MLRLISPTCVKDRRCRSIAHHSKMRVEKLMSNELAVQIEEIQKRLDALEARRTPGPRGPAGDITAAVDNAEKAAKAIIIERLDSYVQRTETIARRVQQQVDSASTNIRSEFQNIVNSAATRALRDALENEVAALVLKILVEYQVADIAGDPIKID